MLLVALFAAFVSAATNATLSNATIPCHDYVLLSARGTYEHQGPSIGFRDMINFTLSKLSNGMEVDLVYPATVPVINSTTTGYYNLLAYLEGQLKRCPKQKYALLGYSQGAAVVDVVLSNYTIGTKGFDAIKAVVVIGNPAHKPYQPSNFDESGGVTTSGVIGAYYNLGVRIPDVWYQSLKVLDICYTGDNICGPAQINSSFVPHLKYGSTPSVQRMGGNFLVGSLTPKLLP